MELTIENVLRIASAKVSLSRRITLLAGKNGAGKTSVLLPLQALIAGDKMPCDIKQKDAILLVHNSAAVGGDTKSGKATLTWDGGKAEVKWPACKLSGDKFQCSKYAAGLAQPSSIPAKDLTELLKILPTKEEFLEEMDSFGPSLGIPSEAVWEKVERLGWDEAHKQAEARRTDMYREWRKLTGQEWGAVQSAKWEPEHFTGQDLESLEQGLRSAERIFEHAVRSQALGEKEKEDLQQLANEVGEHTGQVAQLSAELDEVNAELEKARAMLETIPRAVNPQHAYACWNCGKFGTVSGGKFIQAADPSAAEEDARAAQARLNEQNQRIASLQKQRDDMQLKLQTARVSLEKSKEAERKLNTVPIDEPATVSTEDARAEVELSRKRIAAYHTQAEATEIRNAVGANAIIVGMLSPDGLRKSVVANKLQSFNALLSELCALAGCPAVTLDEVFDIRFGPYPYPIISLAQKLFVNAILQVAIAKLDGSRLIVIDSFDMLDRDLANGLLEVLLSLPIPSVLGCKFNAPEDVPDLSGLDCLSYWCADDTVKPLAEVRA